MMIRCKRLLASVLAGLALAGTAHATDVTLTGANFNQWQSFDVEDSMSPTGNPLGWIDLVYNGDASTLSFSFTLAAPAYLRVVDSGFAGDRFSISDNGNLLGLTSAAGSSGVSYGSTQADLDAAFADAAFSSGSWLLAAGQHVITGSLASTTSAFNATTGALMLAPVPEPESYALFLAGLGLIATIARRRA